MRKNVVRIPKPVHFDVIAFICYGCDTYFFVQRGLHKRHIKCPTMRCQERHVQPECIGSGEIELTLHSDGSGRRL